jgi:LysM repeat protein
MRQVLMPPVFARPQAGIYDAATNSDVVLVKAFSPFVPTVCLISVPSRSRRGRFKKLFFGILAANVLLLLGLLITDYCREVMVSAKEPTAGPAPLAVPAASALVVSAAPEQTAPPRTPASSTQAPAHSETIYSVISSDTLYDIARKHGTTVAAIRAANDLSTDRLAVGQKLKMP